MKRICQKKEDVVKALIYKNIDEFSSDTVYVESVEAMDSYDTKLENGAITEEDAIDSLWALGYDFSGPERTGYKVEYHYADESVYTIRLETIPEELEEYVNKIYY